MVNSSDFLLKIKNSKRRLFKAHCRHLIERENADFKHQLKLQRKKIRKTKEKISTKYKCLNTQIGGLNINYQMYRKVLNSIITRDKLKEAQKTVDFHQVRFIDLKLDLAQTRADILKVYRPLAK